MTVVAEPGFADPQVGDVADVLGVDLGRGEVPAQQVRGLGRGLVGDRGLVAAAQPQPGDPELAHHARRACHPGHRMLVRGPGRSLALREEPIVPRLVSRRTMQAGSHGCGIATGCSGMGEVSWRDFAGVISRRVCGGEAK